MFKQYNNLLSNNIQYRYLWLATLVSLAGDWFNTIATVILVNRYTDSTTAIGALFIARALPPLLLGPVVGFIADRFDRKLVLISTDLMRFFIVLVQTVKAQ